MKQPFRDISIVLLTAIAVLFTSCLKNKPTGEKVIGAAPGQTLPDFSLSDKNGTVVSMSDFRGKTVLIEFWASWCGFCMAEVNDLNALHSDFKEKNFDIVGISIDTDRSSWLKKVSDHNIAYTQLIGENGFDSEFAIACDVKSIPKMILVDSDGVVLLVATRASKVREFLVNYLN